LIREKPMKLTTMFIWILVFFAIVAGTTFICMPPIEEVDAGQGKQAAMAISMKSVDRTRLRGQSKPARHHRTATPFPRTAAFEGGRLSLTVILPDRGGDGTVQIDRAEITSSADGMTNCIGPFTAADSSDKLETSFKVKPGAAYLAAAEVKPGGYVLHVEIEGYMAMEDPVMIRSGVVTALELRFIPEEEENREEDG